MVSPQNSARLCVVSIMFICSFVSVLSVLQGSCDGVSRWREKMEEGCIIHDTYIKKEEIKFPCIFFSLIKMFTSL